MLMCRQSSYSRLIPLYNVAARVILDGMQPGAGASVEYERGFRISGAVSGCYAIVIKEGSGSAENMEKAARRGAAQGDRSASFPPLLGLLLLNLAFSSSS